MLVSMTLCKNAHKQTAFYSTKFLHRPDSVLVKIDRATVTHTGMHFLRYTLLLETLQNGGQPKQLFFHFTTI